MRLPFTDGYNVGISDAFMNQELINAYVHQVLNSNGEVLEEGIVGSPGMEDIRLTVSLDNAPAYGGHEFNGVPYYVQGKNLIKVKSDGTAEIISSGAFPDADGPVSIADNGSQMMILVPGGNGYIFDGTIITQITDVDFTANGAPQIVFFVDSYFVCTTDTKRFIICSENDGFTWNPLDYGVAESDPDPIVSGMNMDAHAVIFGSETTTLYDNVGGNGFPFQRNGDFSKGCSARFSPVKIGESFAMIGAGQNERPAVWMFSGNTFVKISSGAIDGLIQRLTPSELSSVTSYNYSNNNDYFVAWTTPHETIIYNLYTKKWHIRRSIVDNVTTGWRGQYVLKGHSKLWCADRIDGRIGLLGDGNCCEYGEPIRVTFDVRPIRDEKSFAFPRIEVRMQTGNSPLTVTDPTISMRKSKDGKTFGSPRSRSVGLTGKYSKRVVWRRNGIFDGYGLLRFEYSNPHTPLFVVNITAQATGGRV